MEVWKIPVSCELHATVEVEADTKEKAEKIALKKWQDELDHLNILLKGQYQND